MVEKETSNEEKIGFHKGSLSVLAKEKEELQRIVSIVEQLMQMHLKALSDLGVDVTKEREAVSQKEIKKPNTPIEDLI